MRIKECRASPWVLRRFCKSRSGRATRHLQLGDDLTAILAHWKGRATSWQLLARCWRRCALQLVRRVAAVDRRIPSELNPADAASRAFEPRRQARGERADGGHPGAGGAASGSSAAGRPGEVSENAA